MVADIDSETNDSLPIPSYEQAISSRPDVSESRRGPTEISDDAERQGLLRLPTQPLHSMPSGYQPPTVESARSSVDFLPSSDGSARNSTEDLRQEVEQFEVDEADLRTQLHRSQLANRFSKSLTSLTNSLSSFNLPFRRYVPSFSFPRIWPSAWADIEHDRFILLGRLFGALLAVGLVYILLGTDLFSFNRSRSFGQIYDPESLRAYVQSNINQDGHIQQYLEYLTTDIRLAGTKGSRFYAEWVQDLFQSASLEDVAQERFDVYLNYPTENGRRVAIVEPSDLIWEASLEEHVSGDNRQQTYAPVFHGHSKSVGFTGHLVYANRGSREDFAWLKEQGVGLDGAVVIVRHGSGAPSYGEQVKAAEIAGAGACLIYPDTSANDESELPGSPIPSDSVSRGSVSLSSVVYGDPLSPGWASTPEEKRRLQLDESGGLVKIASLPISWENAKHLIQSLKSIGKEAPPDWAGPPLEHDYWTGDQKSPKVHIQNFQDDVAREPIYNVVGRITGWEQPEKKIIVGSRRDAWCLGAADPGSGTAIMLEVVRLFGQLRKLGWRPLRTIEFASWDGEEYNRIGSTEHVEDRIEELRRDGVAYLHVDAGVMGNLFWAAGSPLHERALLRILHRIAHPAFNQTIREAWSDRQATFDGPGAAPHQLMAGVSSLSFGFRGHGYPRHSCYDDFERLAKVNDPGFEYHAAMGQIWALLVLEMADAPMLPFDLVAYAKHFYRDVAELDEYLKSQPQETHMEEKISLSHLFDRAKSLHVEATTFEEWTRAWRDAVYSGNGGLENNVMAIRRMSHNNRMANFETHLLDLKDDSGVSSMTPYCRHDSPLTFELQILEHPQLKHVLYSPQQGNLSGRGAFPSIRDAVDARDWQKAQDQIVKVTNFLGHALHKLNHN